MRRRLDLAAALVARPPVLFLDEPTTGLDPQSRQDLWGVIEELVAGGTTVLLTTQYLEEADRLARNIVVVDHGRVIAEGTPAELKANLGTSVVVHHAERQRDARNGRPRWWPRSRTRSRSSTTTSVELTVENGPEGGRRGAAHARCGAGAHRRAGAARAEPGRRLPEPHRAQVRGRDRGRAGAPARASGETAASDAETEADGRDAA